MMIMNRFLQAFGLVATLIFVLITHAAWALVQPKPVSLGREGIDFIAPDYVEALLDSSRLLTYEDVTASPLQGQFNSRGEDGLNFGVTKKVVWIRFALNNPTLQHDWILLLDNPRLERVELYFRAPTGEVQHMVSGESTPFEVRPYPGREVAFPLMIPPDGQLTVYARIDTAATLSVPLQVLTPRQYEHQTRVSAVMLSSIIGAMVLLFIVAVLGLLRYSGTRMYAYTTMVFVQLVFVLIQDGLGTEYLWPEHPEWTLTLKLFFIFLLAPVALYYTSVTLNFRDYAPKLRMVALALVALGIFGALSSPWLPGQLVNRAATLLSGVTAALLLGAIPYVWLRGNKEARAFFLSGLPLMLSALAVLAHNYALFRFSTAYVFLTYKLTYLLFLTLQLIHTLGRLRVERSEALSQSQRMRAWREVSAELASVQPVPTQSPEKSSVQTSIQTSPHAPNQPIRIHTLGRCEVWRDGNRVRFASRGVPRQQFMLALVLSGGTRGINRTVILDTLWPDSEGDLAEKSFRTTLYRLRQTIGSDALQLSNSTLSVNTEIAWEESTAFEKLATSLVQAIKSNPEPHIIEQAINALRLYAGDFLPGFDLPPVTARREHLRRIFHDLVVRVAEHHIANDAFFSAIEIYQHGLSHSLPSERLFQGLLRCHLALGQHAEGLSAYERCRAFLHEHLNAQPAAETERLKHALADPQGSLIAAPVAR